LYRGWFRSHTLAHLSWITFVISLTFQVLLKIVHWQPQTRIEYLVTGLIKLSFAVTGLTCGIIALRRARNARRPGVLVPALVGVCLWAALFALAIPFLFMTRHRADQRRETAKAVFLPATHIPQGVRVEDAELGFSFELPPGYQKLPKDKLPGTYRLAYMKMNGEKAAEIVLVEGLGGTISPYQHISTKDLPNKSYTLTPFLWRGLTVDGVRIPESSPAGDYVTYKAQIPIRKQSIQLGVGGPASEEAQIRALTEQVLSTLDGPVNW
jgi:hypothetical protein